MTTLNNIDGGVPIQRKRIDDFIANVSGYDFNQCSAALHGPTSLDPDGATDLVGHVGMLGEEMIPSARFLQVLSDRRVAKLYTMLNQMPAAMAAQTASTLFDEKIGIHLSALSREIAIARGQEKPYEPGSDEGGKHIQGCLGGNVHALSASLFLCAAFCKPGVVLEKLDAWYLVINAIQVEMNSDPVLSNLFVRDVVYTLPEKLFLLNIYALAFDRHGCGPVERLIEAVGKRNPREDPRFERNPFYAWDAHTNATDFTHVHRGVAADDSKILTHFWMARRWGSLLFDEERQADVLAAARALVEECANEAANR